MTRSKTKPILTLDAQLHVDTAGLTDRGRTRERNEDQFLIAEMRRSLKLLDSSLDETAAPNVFGNTTSLLVLVADGLGGHSSGEVASALAATELEHAVLDGASVCLDAHDGRDESCFEDELRAAFTRAQKRITEASRANPRLEGMATTITFGYLMGRKLFLGHAGDSRAYLLRAGELSQLTNDHTVARKLQEEGVLEADEVARSPYNDVLWNAVGSVRDEVRPDVRHVGVEPDDVLLFCTDGLTRHLDDADISGILAQDIDAGLMCRELVATANERGGKDNVTAVVVRLFLRESNP